jgi:hypothetical protein
VVRAHYDMKFVAVVNLAMTALALALVHTASRRVEFR